MALRSMTGFSRSSGALDGFAWQWELRSVNGKALDFRIRLAPGCEHLEPDVRTALSQAFKRGNIQASLQVTGEVGNQRVVINDAVLNQVVARARDLRKKLKGPALRADTLMAIRGVVDVAADQPDGAAQAKRTKSMLASFDQAVKDLARMRAEEGARTGTVLTALQQRISELVKAASESPARKPEAIRVKLAEQVARLLEQSATFDPDRLHQEAILLATRADIQEEVDRLNGHLEALGELLQSTDQVGRKLDFLAQEFNREANTLCSKANEKSLTHIGLDLKHAIDQLREQVQNLE